MIERKQLKEIHKYRENDKKIELTSVHIGNICHCSSPSLFIAVGYFISLATIYNRMRPFYPWIANKTYLSTSFAMAFGIDDGILTSTKYYSYMLLQICKWVKKIAHIVTFIQTPTNVVNTRERTQTHTIETKSGKKVQVKEMRHTKNIKCERSLRWIIHIFPGDSFSTHFHLLLHSTSTSNSIIINAKQFIYIIWISYSLLWVNTWKSLSGWKSHFIHTNTQKICCVARTSFCQFVNFAILVCVLFFHFWKDFSSNRLN